MGFINQHSHHWGGPHSHAANIDIDDILPYFACEFWQP